jgi:SAM-dependent methyltransferase
MEETVRLIEDLTDVALGRRGASLPLNGLPDRTEIHQRLLAIAVNESIDSMPEPMGQQRAVKRLVLKLSRFVLVRQRAVNQALTGIVEELLRENEALNAAIDHERRRAAAASAAIDAALVRSSSELQRRLRELTEMIESAVVESRDSVAAVEVALRDEVKAESDASAELMNRHVDDLNAALFLERHRREVLERELRAFKREVWGRGARMPDADSAPGLPPPDSALSELYSRFEDQIRPSGDLESRFAVYLPDLEHLRGGNVPVVDIGTGRGEFLAVLRSAGVPARGIDINVEAVEHARAAGLDVELIDARRFLAAQASETVGAVTALHVAEHMEPEDLLELVDEIVRVLVPGGTIILETPNPTNLVVGASSFYHDPTHRRPLTPEYLAFLLRDRGLVDVQTRFLNPLPEYSLATAVDERPGSLALQRLIDDVRWALKGPQDFAVVARAPSGS